MSLILLVEDNEVSRELLREMLLALGCEVLEAADGREALERLEETEPDLVLLDINMPLLNGFSVLKRVREDLRFRRLPVLAVTAYAMKEDRQRVFDAGFNGYLPKPIDLKTLMGELKRFGILQP